MSDVMLTGWVLYPAVISLSCPIVMYVNYAHLSLIISCYGLIVGHVIPGAHISDVTNVNNGYH